VDWIGVVVAIAVAVFIVAVEETALRRENKRRRTRLKWQCPWCGEVFGNIPDYIDHKDQHLKDEIEKRGGKS